MPRYVLCVQESPKHLASECPRNQEQRKSPTGQSMAVVALLLPSAEGSRDVFSSHRRGGAVRERTRRPGVFTASWEVTGVLYRGGVIKLHARGFFARRMRENFGDVDCKPLHLCPEIDATHTLSTTTNEYAVPTTTMTH